MYDIVLCKIAIIVIILVFYTLFYIFFRKPVPFFKTVYPTLFVAQDDYYVIEKPLIISFEQQRHLKENYAVKLLGTPEHFLKDFRVRNFVEQLPLALVGKNYLRSLFPVEVAFTVQNFRTEGFYKLTQYTSVCQELGVHFVAGENGEALPLQNFAYGGLAAADSARNGNFILLHTNYFRYERQL